MTTEPRPELLTEMHPDRQLAAIQDDPVTAAVAQALFEQAVTQMRHASGQLQGPPPPVLTEAELRALHEDGQH